MNKLCVAILGLAMLSLHLSQVVDCSNGNATGTNNSSPGVVVGRTDSFPLLMLMPLVLGASLLFGFNQ